MKKEFVLLTKSKKHAAYCVAGVDLTTNAWIRIVTPHGGAIDKKDAFYDNGTEVEILDVIEVECIGADNIPFQPENYMIKPKAKWIRKGREDKELLHEKAANDARIREKVFYDTNHYIPCDSLHTLEYNELYSLMIIKIHNPYLILNRDNNDDIPTGKLTFHFKGERYNYFRITDTDFLRAWENQDHMGPMNGDYYIVISLGEEYNGCHYKLIAKVFEC